MKKLLVIGLMVLLAGIVIGQAIGTVLNQSQLDAIDIDAKDMNISIDSISLNGGIRLNISYSTINKMEDGDYNIVRPNATFVFPFEKYHFCRELGNPKSVCVKQIEIDLKTQVRDFKQEEREQVKGWQTKSFASELEISDIGITEQELNEG